MIIVLVLVLVLVLVIDKTVMAEFILDRDKLHVDRFCRMADDTSTSTAALSTSTRRRVVPPYPLTVCSSDTAVERPWAPTTKGIVQMTWPILQSPSLPSWQ